MGASFKLSPEVQKDTARYEVIEPEFDWKHGGFYIWKCVKDFFSPPQHLEKRNLEPLEKVRDLLECYDGKAAPAENIKPAQELVELHRTIENTYARQRLEKWALRVIAGYLIAVFLIVIATYSNVPCLFLLWLNIPNGIMIAILTTTTANIIGLGLIVLRGHFLAKQ